MSCNCSVYDCIDASITSDCTSIITNIIANQTGVWIMFFEFNGRWFKEDVTVTNGEVIILPNVFNESYNHIIEFYKTDDSLFNDTCYTLDMNRIALGGSPVTPDSSNDVMSYVYVFKDSPDTSNPDEQPVGDTVTDNRLIGKTIIDAIGLLQAYSPDTFTQGYNTLTINVASFIDGNQLVVHYINAGV